VAGRGAARRPAGAVADGRNGKQLVDRELTVDVPAKPRGLPAAVRRAWDDFWASDVAVLLQRSDLHTVRRLFQLYAEREHCHDVVLRTHTTRLPLADALRAGVTGTLVHELDDEGETHAFVEIEHEGRVGIGSQGQMVLSPWAKDLRTIDTEIRQLEDRLGLNTRARAALAVVVRPAAPPAPSGPAAPSAGAPSQADHDLLDL
jgi:hypothetical protein